MPRTLTEAQKAKLIKFAEDHADFLDTLLMGDRDEYASIAGDFETVQQIVDGYYGPYTAENARLYREEIRQFDACSALRKALKQTVEA